MTENFKKAWEKIESNIGTCCLHKKAAFREASGQELKQLSLVTCAPPEVIESYLTSLGEKKSANPYRFKVDGVFVELTNITGAKNTDELNERSFKHTLTIDCIGFRRKGGVNDNYGGMADVKEKTVRFTDETATINENLFKRILTLVADDGFRLHPAVKERIKNDKFFEKLGYRKKFFEYFFETVTDTHAGWQKAATLLGIAEEYIKPGIRIIEYTEKISERKSNTNFIRAYLFLIFALMKATSKEISVLFKDDSLFDYYDSVCVKLSTRISNYTQYMELKNNYGQEFLDLLFDVQEIWLTAEGMAYKRPSECDFDLMSALVNDEKYWGEKKQSKPPAVEDSVGDDLIPEDFELEGVLDIGKAVSDVYDGDLYDEPTEGVIEDLYDPAVQKDDSLPAVQKKDVCIDDDYGESGEVSGFEVAGLASYEDELLGGGDAEYVEEPVSPVNAADISSGVINHTRGHSSKILTNGGE